MHPNTVGAASIQRLWAKAVASLYSNSPSTSVVGRASTADVSVSVSVHWNVVQLSGLPGGNTTASLFSVAGKRLETHALRGTSGSFESRLPQGIYVLRLDSRSGAQRAIIRL